MAEGTPSRWRVTPESVTGAYLSGRVQIPLPTAAGAPRGEWIEVLGCRQNNLRGSTSGSRSGSSPWYRRLRSGKSTLVNETLHRALALALRTVRKAG